MNASHTPGLTTTQAAVQIVQNMVQCGMSNADYAEQSETLFGLMSEWAMQQIRTEYMPMYMDRERTVARQTFEQWVLDEEHENEPFALAYWAATSQFFRRVYQAAAAAA